MDKSTLNTRKYLRSPSLKRRSKAVPITERVKLEKVLGLTVSSNAALSCDQNSSVVAYPAGCTVVLYNTKRNKQTHIINHSKKTLTAVAISPDGKYVVTGECGHLPALRIWDMEERVQITEFIGHKFGINCVAFSPNSKYVVSIGTQHDNGVNVWDWKNNLKIAANKVSSKVKAVSFAESGGYFVTVGNRHVKFWYLEHSRSKVKEAVPLMGRSAILGDQRNNYFCDVSCGKGQMSDSTYCITQSGLLCEFNNKRLLDKWVELRTQSANCLCVGEDYIFIGCADGIIRVFSPYTLHFITSFPRPHHLGVDVAGGLTPNHIGLHPPNAKFPDTIAITFDENHNKVTCVYNDHSLYIWDVMDTKKIGKAASFLYHSACIWGIEMYPDLLEEQSLALPPNSFLTCSSDDTIRIWNLEPHLSSDADLKRNMYSQELLKTIYLDEELTYIRDIDYNPAGSNDKTDNSYDGKNGIRAIQISPEGRHLASGDRSGNIRIHDLRFMDEICHIEAHDSEILCLEFSKPETGHRLLASASRDRLIHVFDADQDYSFQQTLDDHSSSITSVRFTSSNNQLQMLSCGADKSIIFRTAQFNPELKFYLNHQVMAKNTMYDMEVDGSRKYILTACQDRNIRVYNIRTSKQTRVFRGALGEDGTLIEIELDQSGTYVATSCSDKNLALFDFYSGECVASMFGHSELVTGLKFTNDCRHLISVSGDGCIFVWKLSPEFTHIMQTRLVQVGKLPQSEHLIKDNLSKRDPFTIMSKPFRTDDLDGEADLNDNFAVHSTGMFDGDYEDEDRDQPDYRFSVGPLPSWAKKQVSGEVISVNSRENTSVVRTAAVQPRGRWAQRMDNQGLIVRSQLDEDNVIQLSYTDLKERRRYTLEDDSDDIIKPKEGMNNDEACEEVLEEFQRRIEIISKLKESESNITLTRGSDILRLSEGRKLSTGEDSTSLSRSSSNASFKYEDVENDGDMEDNDTNEIIYYPPTEENSECGDSNPSSFKVFAISVNDLNNKCRPVRKIKHDETSEASMSSYDSEPFGEGNSEEEFDEPDHNSSPISQPQVLRLTERQYFGSMDNLDNSDHQENYIKNNFDTQFSPSTRERFEQTMSTLEKHLLRNEIPTTSRQSISTRFLTHSQQNTSLRYNSSSLPRNVALHNATIQKRGGIVTIGREAVSKRRADLNREMEEKKKRMEAPPRFHPTRQLGWKAGKEMKTKSTIDLRNLSEKSTGSHNRYDSGIPLNSDLVDSLFELGCLVAECTNLDSKLINSLPNSCIKLENASDSPDFITNNNPTLETTSDNESVGSSNAVQDDDSEKLENKEVYLVHFSKDEISERLRNLSSLARKVPLETLLPSKSFFTGDSGIFDLRKACSLTDLSSARSHRRTLPAVPSHLDLKGSIGDSIRRSTSRERSKTVLATSAPPRKRSESRLTPGTPPTSSPTHRPRTAPSGINHREPSYAKSTESSNAKAVNTKMSRSSSMYSLESSIDDRKDNISVESNSQGRSSTSSSPSRNRGRSVMLTSLSKNDRDIRRSMPKSTSSTNVAGKPNSISTKKSNKDPKRRNTVAVTSESFKEMMKVESLGSTNTGPKNPESRQRTRSKSAERKQSSSSNDEKMNSKLSNTRAKIEYFSQVQNQNKTQQTTISSRIALKSDKADRCKDPDRLIMPPPSSILKNQNDSFFRKNITSISKWKSNNSISGEKDTCDFDKSPQDLPEKDLNTVNSSDKYKEFYPEKLPKESKWLELEDKSSSITRQTTYSPVHSSSLVLIKTAPKNSEQSCLSDNLGENSNSSILPGDTLEYCKSAAIDLKGAVEKATKAYQLVISSSSIQIEEKAEMLAILSEAFCTAQETLYNTTKSGEWNPNITSLFTPSNLISLKEQLIQKQHKGQGSENIALNSTVTLLQQYSDMLLNLVQQKIEPESNIKKS